MAQNQTEHPDDIVRLSEKFTPLILAHQDYLHSFILSLVPNFSDADDIFQETLFIMCRKFDEFEPGSNFLAWSLNIARKNVMNFRRKQKKQQTNFCPETLQKLIERTSQLKNRHVENRMQALEKCIEKLNKKDRELMKLRYSLGLKTELISQKINRSSESIYHSFSRIIKNVRSCIVRSLSVSE